GRRGSFLSEDRRREPGALVDLLRGPPSLARHRRIRIHLPVVRGSVVRGGRGQHHGASRDQREHERPDCLRRPWRDDGRLLVERPLVHGEPALLEKEIGNLQLYMMAPMNRMALLGGMAVGGMVMTSMRAISTLVAGVLVFGVIFQVASPLMLLAVFFATLIALYGLGMMFASLYLLWGREAWNLSALMEEPIFFSSGFYFPLGGLLRIPGWGPAIAIAGSFIPASLGLDALRQLTLGSTAFGSNFWIFDVTTELEILVGMAVLFLILARYCLAYLETLAKREGKLTSRHQ